jgi:hypothetical protein
MRTGWFREAHMKSADSYRFRLLLTQRRNLKRKFLDLENAVRHSLKLFGIKLGTVGRGRFERAVLAAVAEDPLAGRVMAAMLRARAALWTEYLAFNKLVVQIAMQNELCRRFMASPGVGPITALSFATAVEDPSRFRRSRDVAAYFGLPSSGMPAPPRAGAGRRGRSSPTGWATCSRWRTRQRGWSRGGRSTTASAGGAPPARPSATASPAASTTPRVG